MAMQQIPHPAEMKMSTNMATEWTRFSSQWANFEVAADLKKESSARRAAIFLACVGTEAYEVFETMEFEDDEDRRDIDKVIDAFRKHCIGEINLTYERYVFNRRGQEPGESFDAFLAELRRLVRSCEYGALEESILKDRIVVGLRDDATRRKLLQIRKLDLANAIDICKASEVASRQLKAMTSPEDVSALKATKDKKYCGSSRGRRGRNDDRERDRNRSASRNDRQR